MMLVMNPQQPVQRNLTMAGPQALAVKPVIMKMVVVPVIVEARSLLAVAQTKLVPVVV